jgi:hypothetical protein
MSWRSCSPPQAPDMHPLCLRRDGSSGADLHVWPREQPERYYSFQTAVHATMVYYPSIAKAVELGP